MLLGDSFLLLIKGTLETTVHSFSSGRGCTKLRRLALQQPPCDSEGELIQRRRLTQDERRSVCKC